ncbi:hypothetical protein BELL_0676g00040 [Botrytis elliptica]|uniref:Uncharacterized protein n=1 Tax=Botrytis elliptica TaxID=278938 RepID=A0A4Z1JHE3_9HELO|nr:hypothetical protein EAE99_012403 [Botrytis elliptica]TGO70732.1 hypothetical protein BELL_0676g00040 [Botrytis elliptica]
MKMPWGSFMPISRYNKMPVSVGRKGTILQAVQVDSAHEMSLVAMATWAVLENKWKEAVEINPTIEKGRIKAAAHAIADISFAAMASPESLDRGLVRWWNILHEALLNPDWTLARFKARYRRPKVVPAASKNDSRGNELVTLPIADDDPEQEDDDLGYDNIENIPKGKKLLFLSRDGADGDDVDDDNDDEYEDEVGSSKTKRQMSPWQFVPGQDLRPACLATPDTSKFFMVRQLRKDPGVINVREYPNIAGFDWSDKQAIHALNRGRNQIILRTNGPKTAPRLAWSQVEKDLLRHQVIKGLINGYTKHNMPWEQVAHNINVDLEKVTQKQGSALAIPSKWNAGTQRIDYKTKRCCEMRKDRTGSDRNASGCMNQAAKFGDIDLLLRNSIEHPSKRKSVDEVLKIIHGAHQDPPSNIRAGTTACAAPDTEMQMVDKGEHSGVESSSTRTDKMQVDGSDDSSDNEPLMKRRKSGQADGKKPSGNVHPMTRRNSEKSQ